MIFSWLNFQLWLLIGWLPDVFFWICTNNCSFKVAIILATTRPITWFDWWSCLVKVMQVFLWVCLESSRTISHNRWLASGQRCRSFWLVLSENVIYVIPDYVMISKISGTCSARFLTPGGQWEWRNSLPVPCIAGPAPVPKTFLKKGVNPTDVFLFLNCVILSFIRF